MYIAKIQKSARSISESAKGRVVARKDASTSALKPEVHSGGTQLFLQPFQWQTVERQEQGAAQEMAAVYEQAKLTVGAVDDEFEREAEHVARLVMGRADSDPAEPLEGPRQPLRNTGQNRSFTPLYLQGLCREGKDEGKLEGKLSGEREVEYEKSDDTFTLSSGHGGADFVPLSSGGRPFPRLIEARIGSLLGVDLGHVKVHDDQAANVAALLMNAKAFTHQNHIYLGKGQSANDMRLMAHEATHVVQQGAAGMGE
jgi:hypothetical protein